MTYAAMSGSGLGMTTKMKGALATLMPMFGVCNAVVGQGKVGSAEYQKCLDKAKAQLAAGVPEQAVRDALLAEKQGRTWVMYAGVGALVLIGGAWWFTRKKTT